MNNTFLKMCRQEFENGIFLLIIRNGRYNDYNGHKKLNEM